MFTVCRMLQMEDKLKGHPLYFDAAKLAMEVSFLDQCSLEVMPVPLSRLWEDLLVWLLETEVCATLCHSTLQIYLHLHDKPVAKQHENGRQEEESKFLQWQFTYYW